MFKSCMAASVFFDRFLVYGDTENVGKLIFFTFLVSFFIEISPFYLYYMSPSIEHE